VNPSTVATETQEPKEDKEAAARLQGGAMQVVSIDQFVAGLRSIPGERFGIGIVFDYLKDRAVDAASLERFCFFSPSHYTRNLIFKDDLFELLAICWDVGQISRIHNHQNQNCWMSIPIGKLRIQNFRVVEQNPATGYCRIEPADFFDIQRGLPAEVDPAEPVHQVSNLAEFNERAVSLHIYSRPFDRCLIYSREANKYAEVPLHYSSEYGELCAGVKL
jgi:cysteine dioxygenase